MSQYITIQVGQCGNQIGSAFWPLTLHEYGVETKSGGVNYLKILKNQHRNVYDISEAFESFFHIPQNTGNMCFKTVSDLTEAKIRARAVLIDMEDSVVSRFKHGPLRNLFDETCIVSNYPGSGNNWAVGYYTHGSQYHEKLEETIRRTVEKCSQLHGFLIMHSLGGGTGSGLGTATLKLLYDMYPHVSRLVSCVLPTKNQDVITAPYNVMLSMRELTEYATCVFPADNDALLDICNAQLRQKNNKDQLIYNSNCKPFQDMNSIIVNMLLHLTSGSRFPGNLNVDMSDLVSNLIPYPKLHYLSSSVSPICLSAPADIVRTKIQDELFLDVLSRNNYLIKINPTHPNSVVLATACIGRGDISLTDMKRNVERIQKKLNYTFWSKEAMKIGLCSTPPAGHPSSLLCLLNSTTISSLFKDLLKQFTQIYERKAHIHHYTNVDGFEEAFFTECKENLDDLRMRYAEIQNQKIIDVPRLQLR